jgi:hypothetical protein
MTQPKGFEVPMREHQICRLKNTIYGLRQASRAWYSNLDSFFHSLGFWRDNFGHNLYYNVSSENYM